MTNATIGENNSTNHDQIDGENCNGAGNTDEKKQNCDLNTLQKLTNHCSNNTHNNSTSPAFPDCEITTTTESIQENNTKNNQVVDKNTVLKYVYKKGETEIPAKNKGHFRNSLRRRKRSVNESQNKSPLPSKLLKPAVIVNYETSHGPREIEPLLPLQKTRNTILGTNLAHFNIETLHDNSNIKNEENIALNLKKHSTEVENLNEAGNESSEREDFKQNQGNRKSNHESNEREEKKDYKNQKFNRDNEDYQNQRPSLEGDDSAEREDYKNRKSNRDSKSSGEHQDYRNKRPSLEDDDSTERNDYKNRKSNRDNENSREHEDYRNKKPSRADNDSAEPEQGEKGEDEDYYRNIKSRRESDHIGEHEDDKNNRSSHESNGSRDRNTYRKSESSNERYDSRERENYRRGNSDEQRDTKSDRNGSADNSNSAEGAEILAQTKPRHLSPNDNNKESYESNENVKTDPNGAESTESEEKYDKVIKPHVENEESRKFGQINQDDGSYEAQHLKDSSESTGDSYDSIEEKTKTKEKQVKYKANQANHNKSLPSPIRDVHLSDFRKERVEAQKDYLENIDPNTAVEILPLSTASPNHEIKKNVQSSLTSDHTLRIPEEDINDGGKLIHINDGEVKPVVEINFENDSGSSEENSKPTLSDEVESLESILGVNEPEILDDSGQSDKIVAQKEVQNGDVKQQFERIPLNYNHVEKNQNKTTEAPKAEDSGVTKSDGTLDVFAPEDVRYDENLNIKFDDLTIKLPEIKLPDDILAYTRDSSPYSDENQKQPKEEVSIYKPNFYYNHDDSDETPERKEKNDDIDDDNDDHKPDSGYYGYFGDHEKNQNYKNNNNVEESDEEEDLYEKFVRERFGKRGTFKKRSEKLEMAPQDPQLFKTIKNILKKTADIDEQAKKSGDPKAGYMWTLEYGEKL